MTSPTGLGAEAEGFVLVVVLGGGAPAVAVVPAFGGAGVVLVSLEGGGAPQEAVVAALRRAAGVLGAHEQEGELTELPVGVAKLHLHHWDGEEEEEEKKEK
ncbi:hypothetical protein EYF80_054299 [Liparis tanakae]|uniref:Uncharacterized protein n=1 Tax=Liparis tanakae TaxID=230148 RepID=A0A4Z2F4Z6_9TELE|nr:hypothetical protein EYF80_054299 [Liparis tanakae]